MAIVVPGLRRRKGQSLPSFLWRLAHKFSIFAPITVGSGYGIVLGIAAQANQGTGAREFFDNQIVMWRAIVLAPYGIYWFFAFLVVWLLVVLWTGQKSEQAEKASRPSSPALQERKQAKASWRGPRLQDTSQAAPQSGRGDRDTSVAEALGWAIHAAWGTPVHALVISIPPLDLDGPIERLRQAARNGQLRVWGRREPNGLIELIDREFWEDNTVDKRSFRNVFGPSSTTPFEGVEKDERFYGIMLNRAEVERIWPHAG